METIEIKNNHKPDDKPHQWVGKTIVCPSCGSKFKVTQDDRPHVLKQEGLYGKPALPCGNPDCSCRIPMPLLR